MSFDVVYISPHPDDVAFSAAAQVAEDVAAGARVALFTLFQTIRGEAPSTMKDPAVRRAEDEAYAAQAGVSLIAGGFIDAVARRPGYLGHRLFSRLGTADNPLVEEIRAALTSIVTAGCRQVVAPLGIGEHVDHQIAHAAARRLTGVKVRFYEDTPYVLTPYALARRLHRLGWHVEAGKDPTLQRGCPAAELGSAVRTWVSWPVLKDLAPPLLLPLAALALTLPEALAPLRSRSERRALPTQPASSRLVSVDADKKLRAIACYGSQWRLFYRTLDEWRDALVTYGRTIGATEMIERAWYSG